MPYSKFPTNLVVLQRILFEIENSRGSTSVAQATLTVRNELVALWEYAGYGDILKPFSNNHLIKMKQLHIDYKSLVKFTLSRRDGAVFKGKLKKHYAKLPLLFDISDKLLQTSNLNSSSIPRGDYKEFLELAKIFLGGSIDRKKGYTYQLSRPGADHHARWMSKCIYFLKLFLLSHQFPQSVLSWQKKKKVESMAFFVVFPYLMSWFSSPSLVGAAENDLNLFRRLQKFSRISKKISSGASAVLQRHTWYLTEEMIPVSLFNKNIPIEERNSLAAKVGSLQATDVPIGKPKLPQMSGCSKLTDFIGPRSVLLFNLIGVSHKFLLEDDWTSHPDYDVTEAALRNLPPLNDSCERSLALATLVNG